MSGLQWGIEATKPTPLPSPSLSTTCLHVDAAEGVHVLPRHEVRLEEDDGRRECRCYTLLRAAHGDTRNDVDISGALNFHETRSECNLGHSIRRLDCCDLRGLIGVATSQCINNGLMGAMELFVFKINIKNGVPTLVARRKGEVRLY